MSEEARAKIRAAWARRAALGLPGPRLGIKHTDETRARISAASRERTPRGAEHYAWKGGRWDVQERHRKSPGYKSWRRAVRDNAGGYCEGCQCRRAKRMHAHHLKGFATHPELRLDPSNGAWLCEDCHRAVHSIEDAA